MKDFFGLLEALQKAGPSVNHLLAIFDSFGARVIGALLNVPDIAQQLRDYSGALRDTGFAAVTAERRMAGLPGAWLRLKSAMEGAILAWANSGLRDDLIATFDAIRGFIDGLYVREVEAGTGRVVARLKENAAWWLKWGARVLLAGAALAAFGVIVGVVSFGLGSLVAAVTGVVTALGWLAGAFFWVLGVEAAAALGAFLGTVTAFVIAGGLIAAVIAAIAGAAYLIYEYWGPFKAFFADLWAGITSDAQAARDWFMKNMWPKIAADAQTARDWIATKFSEIGAAIKNALSSGWEAAKAAAQSGWAGIVGVFEGAYGRIKAIIDAIGAAISGIGSAISGLGGKASGVPGKGAGKMFEARAGGGPVAGGMPYLVGERGPELFMPGQDGHIFSAANLRAAAAGLAFGAAAPLIGAGAIPASAQPAAPQITAHITINVTGPAEPEDIARRVTAALNDVARSALHDGAYD